jgi:uncharacterized RDD family membrane protein YckC
MKLFRAKYALYLFGNTLYKMYYMVKRNYFLKSAIKRARLTRLVAKCVDMFIVTILSFFFYPVGIILAGIYISVADSLQNGQSVGKKLMGFSVISLEDGKPCTVRQSFIRNLPLLIPIVVAIVPIWGWLFACILGFPLIAFELYMLFKLDSGKRLGDVMADTTVVANDADLIKSDKQKTSWFESTSELQP